MVRDQGDGAPALVALGVQDERPGLRDRHAGTGDHGVDPVERGRREGDAGDVREHARAARADGEHPRGGQPGRDDHAADGRLAQEVRQDFRDVLGAFHAVDAGAVVEEAVHQEVERLGGARRVLAAGAVGARRFGGHEGGGRRRRGADWVCRRRRVAGPVCRRRRVVGPEGVADTGEDYVARGGRRRTPSSSPLPRAAIGSRRAAGPLLAARRSLAERGVVRRKSVLWPNNPAFGG